MRVSANSDSSSLLHIVLANDQTQIFNDMMSNADCAHEQLALEIAQYKCSIAIAILQARYASVVSQHQKPVERVTY